MRLLGLDRMQAQQYG